MTGNSFKCHKIYDVNTSDKHDANMMNISPTSEPVLERGVFTGNEWVTVKYKKNKIVTNSSTDDQCGHSVKASENSSRNVTNRTQSNF